MPIVIFFDGDDAFFLDDLLEADDFLAADVLRDELLAFLAVPLREELLDLPDFLGDLRAALRFLPPTSPLPERSIVSTFLARYLSKTVSSCSSLGPEKRKRFWNSIGITYESAKISPVYTIYR